MKSADELFRSQKHADEFWDVIAKAGGDRQRLGEVLETVNRGRLTRFCWYIEEIPAELHDARFAPYLEPGMTPDSLDDLFRWVVSRGRESFEEIWQDPSRIPSCLPPGTRNPGFLGEATDLYQIRYNELPPDRPVYSR